EHLADPRGELGGVLTRTGTLGERVGDLPVGGVGDLPGELVGAGLDEVLDGGVGEVEHDVEHVRDPGAGGGRDGLVEVGGEVGGLGGPELAVVDGGGVDDVAAFGLAATFAGEPVDGG